MTGTRLALPGRSVAWMRHLAASERPLALFAPGLLPRSAIQLVIVVLHVLRRLAPPW